jgi:hypothetical protein
MEAGEDDLTEGVAAMKEETRKTAVTWLLVVFGAALGSVVGALLAIGTLVVLYLIKSAG